MTQFSAAIGSLINRGFAGRTLVGAAAVAATLSLAGPAAAAVTLKTATPQDMQQLGTTTTTLPGREYFGMSPYVITASDNGHNFSALAFCVQFFVDMPSNFNADWTLNTVDGAYHEGDFLSLENTSAEVQTKVYNLIEYGSDLWLADNHAASLSLQLAAIQGAIWQIMVGNTFVFMDYGVSDPANNGLIQDFVTLASTPRASEAQVRTLISDGGDMQAIAYSLRTAVPEPGTWALMLVGFFTVGAGVRASRRRLVSTL